MEIQIVLKFSVYTVYHEVGTESTEYWFGTGRTWLVCSVNSVNSLRSLWLKDMGYFYHGVHEVGTEDLEFGYY